MPGPHVNPSHLEAVRRRLTAPVQAAPLRAAPGLFVRAYRHTAAQTPGWQLQRQRTLPQPPDRPDVLRLSQLMLGLPEQPACRIKVEVYETPSPEAAQALMVELLTGFQALPDKVPVVAEVGDSGIVLPGDFARFFIRGNLLVALANAGAERVAVGAAARALDAFLTAAPQARAAPARARAAAAAAGPGAADAMQRFVAPAGGLRQNAQGQVEAEGDTPSVDTLDEHEDAWISTGPATSTDTGGDGGDTPPPTRPPRRKR